MKFGITTNIFREPLASGEVNLGGLVDFAEDEGFSAIEVRDDEASLAVDNVQDFLKDAGAKGIEVSYAIANDMLQEDDRALVDRGIERAALGGDGAILRLLASQSALAPKEKSGYTAGEIRAISDKAREYAGRAAGKGVFLAIEHAREPLRGDGQTYFGLEDIFDALQRSGGVPANIGITFDPANAVFKSLCKAPTEPGKVLEFLEAHSEHIALVHYKTTSGGEPTPVITDSDIDNEALFAGLSKAYDGIVCLEIPSAGDLAECRANIEASLEYLRKVGLMGYFARKGGA
ncbi:MAG: sugar phosphate isomerase/epimerase [Planctomycetes bacterium]|nr:sugar phosphate isomerase/epimerase [Planctomycetota bacterium]